MSDFKKMDLQKVEERAKKKVLQSGRSVNTDIMNNMKNCGF